MTILYLKKNKTKNKKIKNIAVLTNSSSISASLFYHKRRSRGNFIDGQSCLEELDSNLKKLFECQCEGKVSPLLAFTRVGQRDGNNTFHCVTATPTDEADLYMQPEHR
jgi:hypothetical protein